MLGQGGVGAVSVAVQPRQQRPALQVGRNLNCGQVEDGRQHVERLGQPGIGACAGSIARQTHKQRNAAALVVGGVALAITQVFTEPLAVIGGEDDDGFIGQSQLFERSKHATDVMVDFADLAKVALPRQSQFFVGEVARVALRFHFGREGRQGQGRGVVEVEVLLRRHPRGVGRVDAGDAEEVLA